MLHIRPESRQEAHSILSDGLKGLATVMTMDEAVSAGLFGDPASVTAPFRARLGDILILPFKEHFIWWNEPGRIGNTFHGHHGGLASEELITVLGVVGEV